MIIIEFHKKINTINQNIYSSVISSLDFSSVHCPKCNESGLKVHAYYYRAFKNSSIRITRLICPHCGSTHAVLLSPMIPFISSVSYPLFHTPCFIPSALYLLFHTFCSILSVLFMRLPHISQPPLFLSLLFRLLLHPLLRLLPHPLLHLLLRSLASSPTPPPRQASAPF